MSERLDDLEHSYFTLRRAIDALSERLDDLEAEPSATQPAEPPSRAALMRARHLTGLSRSDD